MKLSKKEFRKKVQAIRNMMPYYSNGRRVVVLAEGTRKGDEIIAKASNWEGYDLRQVYDYWSDAKQKAFDDAYEMYCNSRHGESFGICSHNFNMFTVSWLHDDGLTFLTPATEYLVIFNE